MKLTVITNGDGPEMRDALEFAEAMASEKYEVETIDWDDAAAVSLASLYDIFSTPAYIVTENDGRLIEMWQGENIPLKSDIKHLLN